jgi:hypothetical protein
MRLHFADGTSAPVFRETAVDRGATADPCAAQAQLTCENRLEVIPGATHLFDEPGALEQVADLARDWFIRHFAQLAGAGTGHS